VDTQPDCLPDRLGRTTEHRLCDRLKSGGFAVTAEIAPPRGADTGPIVAKAAPLRGLVDAVNITDNQGSNVRLSSLAGSLGALAAGVEPIMQMTCRDRNRIALQSDLLAAGALGIPNLLAMTGDHPRGGDHADATPVFDLGSAELLAVARALRDEGRLMSGREVDPAPDYFLGAVENPFVADGSAPAKLAHKVAAGAQFVQTQFVFDVGAFRRFLVEVEDLGLLGQCHLLAGVGPIRSHRALEYLRHRVPGVHVPDGVARRLEAVPEHQVAREGTRLCVELIQELREVPGVDGVHIMAPGFESGIPEILHDAGLAGR
jgi:methylenetetrahydrofolate reductase (NADPH)